MKAIMSSGVINSVGMPEGDLRLDAVRTIDDILDYTRHKKMLGLLVAIDFEKAFDSLDHTYLFKVLNAFNFKFGPSFIRWIRVLYSNISSCIINNGFTSIFLQLVEVCGKETHSHLFFSYQD